MTHPAPKPTNTEDWVSSGPGVIVEPGNTDKANGFVDGFAYPASWFNWKWAKDSAWFQWLQDLLPYGQVSIGESLISGLADTVLPRLKFPIPSHSVATRTALIAPNLLDTLGLGWTLYALNPDDLGMTAELVINGYWDTGSGGQWKRRAGGKHTTILRLDFDGHLRVYRRESGSASPWTDTYDAAGWETRLFDISTTATHFVADLDVANAIFTTISVLTHVLGDLTIVQDLTAGRDLIGGRDLALTRNAAVGGNATVTGTLGAGATTVTSLHSTGALSTDGNTTLGNSTGDTVTCAGPITAHYGIQTSEPAAFWGAFDGSGGAVDGLWDGNSVGIKRKYRQRDGAVVWIAIFADAGPSIDLQVQVIANASTVLGIVTLPAGQQYAQAVLSSSNAYSQNDYLKLTLSVVGMGTLAATRNIEAHVSLVE